MEDASSEPRATELGRVEAFSDGVIAIIITIMVLELKVPEHVGFAALFELWPIFSAYVLSFAYVAIYWVNHHRLFTLARRASNGLLWSNMALLFALSLTPFAAAYLGEHHFEPFSVGVYLFALCLPAFAYLVMQLVIERQGRPTPQAARYLAATRRKGIVSCGIYAVGVALSLLAPSLALLAATIVALLWMLPDTPVDKLFGIETLNGHRERE